MDTRAVLDLAREVAHRVARPAAPVTCLLVGLAAASAADLDNVIDRVRGVAAGAGRSRRMSATSEAFDALVSGVDYPMFIVTAAADGEQSRMSDRLFHPGKHRPRSPARDAVEAQPHVPGRATDRHPCRAFPPHDNHDLAELFGEETGDNTDKFQACDWTAGPAGAPVLEGVRGWVAGRVVARLDAGDHVAHVLDTIEAQAFAAGPRTDVSDGPRPGPGPRGLTLGRTAQDAATFAAC